jgi:hypothetical protein
MHPRGIFEGLVLLAIIVLFAAHQYPSVFFEVEDKAEAHNIVLSEYVSVSNETHKIGSFGDVGKRAGTVVIEEVNVCDRFKFLVADWADVATAAQSWPTGQGSRDCGACRRASA